MKTSTFVRNSAVIFLMAAFAVAPASVADAKTKIESLDDLPRFSYPVEGSVVDILTSDQAFGEFAVKVRADIEGVLAEYEIDDAAKDIAVSVGVAGQRDHAQGDVPIGEHGLIAAVT